MSETKDSTLKTGEIASSLSTLSIDRPVLATVFSLLIILVGVISFLRLPVREYPDIDPPVVTVTTVYPGANPSVIESEITDLIEEELTGVEGIRTMTSTSRDQVSSIIVEFELERDTDIAAQDIRDKISRIQSQLPENADDPVVAKADSDSQPIMWILVKSTSSKLINLSEYVDREVRPYLQNITGVANVIFGGERRKSIQVILDPKKLAFYGLTVLDIDSALKSNNIELPAGSVLSKTKQFSLYVNAEMTQVEEYQNLIVKSDGIRVVKLKDIALIREGAENDQSFVRFNGQQGFGLGVLRQPKSNTVKISDLVHEKITELNEKLPEGIELEVGFDAATFIRLSINDVYKTILLASLLVLLIIYIFLRNMRSTLVPAVSIPISLIGVMGGIYMLGFTVNLMTLLGLIIAVGIVVDDSIIVLENIYRYMENGVPPVEAAKRGANEITLAVIATTLVLVAIFLPIAFMSGITGRLLSEFAFALCVATIISSFVALTMAPMLCSKLLASKFEKKIIQGEVIEQPQKGFKKWFDTFFENIFSGLERSYEFMISAVIKFKATVVLVSLALCVLASVFFYQVSAKDFIPNEDRGVFFTIFQTPRGSNLEYLDGVIRKAENSLMTLPELKTAISVAAFGVDAPGKVTSGIIIVRLVDWAKRSRDVFAITGPLYGTFSQFPEAFVLPILPKSGPSNGFGAQPIQLVIKSDNVDFLVKSSAQIVQGAFALPSIMFAKTDLTLDKPEFTVSINRDKALSLGVSMDDISRTLEILFAGVDVTEFNESGEKYEVIVRVPKDEREDKQKVGEVGVRAANGNLVQLSNLITIKETIGAEEINHYNRKKSVTIEASPKKGFTAAEGLAEIEELALNVIAEMKKAGKVPADYEIDYKGTSKELKDSNVSLYFGFLVALLFAYLFLAGQFESFLSPIIIMLTVPLAVTGALAGIAFFKLFPVITNILINQFGLPFWLQFVIPQFNNISLNIYSQIGIIMLVGMASKNGILLVEFINQLRDEGMALEKAIITASKLRLRPILMTAFSTVLGILPIALALGVGSTSRQALGIAVVTGMSFSTFLTLFIVPCAYGLLGKFVRTKA